jgi:hypothetical protein
MSSYLWTSEIDKSLTTERSPASRDYGELILVERAEAPD